MTNDTVQRYSAPWFYITWKCKLCLGFQNNMAIVTMTSLICIFSCIHFLYMISSAQCLAICILANISARRAGSRQRCEGGGGDIAKQLKVGMHSKHQKHYYKGHSIQNRERNWWGIIQLNVQTKTDKRKILSSGNILKLLQNNEIWCVHSTQSAENMLALYISANVLRKCFWNNFIPVLYDTCRKTQWNVINIVKQLVRLRQ